MNTDGSYHEIMKLTKEISSYKQQLFQINREKEGFSEDLFNYLTLIKNLYQNNDTIRLELGQIDRELGEAKATANQYHMKLMRNQVRSNDTCLPRYCRREFRQACYTGPK